MSLRAFAGALPAVALAASAASLSFPAGPLRVDLGQIADVESAYQTVRVVEAEEDAFSPGPRGVFEMTSQRIRQRFLRFDEDTGSYQSVHPLGVPAESLTFGRYYDHLTLGLWFEGMPWSRADGGRPRVLIVGYAGGTLARTIAATAPRGREAEVVGVELDPAVPSLALGHLDPSGPLDPAARVVTGEDGRPYVDALQASERFDLIVVDAYQRTQYVPFQVATLEFFRSCARHLTPAGAIGFNVNAPRGLAGGLLKGVAATLSKAMGEEGGGEAWVVPNPHYLGNAAVWGTRSHRAPRVAGGVPHSLLVPATLLDRLLVRFDPKADGGTLLTDDRAPIERLEDEALIEEAE